MGGKSPDSTNRQKQEVQVPCIEMPRLIKNELSEKIKRYTCAEWWEPTQAEQAALVLCIRKKNNTL